MNPAIIKLIVSILMITIPTYMLLDKNKTKATMYLVKSHVIFIVVGVFLLINSIRELI